MQPSATPLRAGAPRRLRDACTTGAGMLAIAAAALLAHAPLYGRSPAALEAIDRLAPPASAPALARFAPGIVSALAGPLAAGALHLIGTGLLLLALRALGARPGVALFVTGLHALHPLHTEALAWPAQHVALLGYALFFLALRIHAGGSGAPSPLRSLGLAALQLLGLACTPAFVVLPLALLLLDAWPLGRVRRANALERLREKWPLFAISAAALASGLGAAQGLDAAADATARPFAARLANAPIALTALLRQSFVPMDLAVYYAWPADDASGRTVRPLLAGLGLALGAAGALANWRRAPWLGFGLSWFVLLATPALLVLGGDASARPASASVLAHAGLFLALAAPLAAASERWPRARRALPLAAGLLLAAAAALSQAEARHWRDARSLYAHALQAAGPAAFVHARLGRACDEAGDADCAREHYARAARLAPRDAGLAYRAALALAAQGREEAAIAAYREVLARDAAHVGANTNLANALLRRGEPAAAARHYERALERDPDAIEARNGLAQTLAAAGRLDAAIAQLERASSVAPRDARLHANLGAMLAAAGRLHDAREALEHALQLDPRLAHARFNLAAVLARSGARSEALRELERLEHIAPDHADAARLRALLERGADAGRDAASR